MRTALVCMGAIVEGWRAAPHPPAACRAAATAVAVPRRPVVSRCFVRAGGRAGQRLAVPAWVGWWWWARGVGCYLRAGSQGCCWLRPVHSCWVACDCRCGCVCCMFRGSARKLAACAAVLGPQLSHCWVVNKVLYCIGSASVTLHACCCALHRTRWSAGGMPCCCHVAGVVWGSAQLARWLWVGGPACG